MESDRNIGHPEDSKKRVIFAGSGWPCLKFMSPDDDYILNEQI